MCAEEPIHADQDAGIVSATPHPMWAHLPNVVGWPRDASDAFYEAVSAKYFSEAVVVDRFVFCVLLCRACSPRDAVWALQEEGAFATLAGRMALIAIVEEARRSNRNPPLCADGVLDTVERYARFAFVLSGTEVTCGAMPVH